MKTKAILLTLSLLIGVMSAPAQEWRGYLEIHAGISPVKSDLKFSDASFYNVWNPISFGLNYTMGIKVMPQLFAGIGIGGYTSMMNYDNYEYSYDYTDRVFPALYFPVFLNARWIPDITKNINPFVDLKIGYQMGVALENDELYTYHSYDLEYYSRYKNGLFLQPGVGVRFGRDSAFNLGLAYNVSVGREFVSLSCLNPNFPAVERFKKNYGVLMITFGADF